MLVRTCRNWKSYTLLMGMQNGTVTMENNLAVPQKLIYKVTL